jgi:hypothetical protein
MTNNEAHSADDAKWRHGLERDDHHRRLDQAQRRHAQLDEFINDANKAAIESANLVFRTLVFINGGAAVAVLAFVGGLISQNKLSIGPQVSDIAFSLVLFAFGVLAASAGIGCAYFINFCAVGHAQSFSRLWEHPHVIETPAARWWRYVAMLFRALAIFFGLGAALLFAWGALEVRSAVIKPAATAVAAATATAGDTRMSALTDWISASGPRVEHLEPSVR